MGRGQRGAAATTTLRARVSGAASSLFSKAGPKYPNEEFGYGPPDVNAYGEQILMRWRTPQGYGGNPGDMFWLKSSQEFVVLHNKYAPAAEPSYPGAVDGGSKEVYRGSSLEEAVAAMEKIAALEGASCTPPQGWLEYQSEIVGFKMPPTRPA